MTVTWAGNRRGPQPARLAAPGDAAVWRARHEAGTPVLLLFDRGRPVSPLVVGAVRDSIDQPPQAPSATVKLEATGEMTLVCGAGSIVITKNGRIIIRGVDVTTRASHTNKIKGGSVQIN